MARSAPVHDRDGRWRQVHHCPGGGVLRDAPAASASSGMAQVATVLDARTSMTAAVRSKLALSKIAGSVCVWSKTQIWGQQLERGSGWCPELSFSEAGLGPGGWQVAIGIATQAGAPPGVGLPGSRRRSGPCFCGG